MRAKKVYESLGDLFVPKNAEQIERELKPRDEKLEREYNAFNGDNYSLVVFDYDDREKMKEFYREYLPNIDAHPAYLKNGSRFFALLTRRGELSYSGRMHPQYFDIIEAVDKSNMFVDKKDVQAIIDNEFNNE